MNRRDLFRQAFVGGAVAASAGVAPALEFPSDYDASKDLAVAEWRPAFFAEHQNETLIVFSDLLIPQTDTPGAKAALVNRFLDRLMAAENHETQRAFLDSLAFLDGESFARYGAAFVYLTPEQQNDVVTFMAYPHTLETWEESVKGEYAGHIHFKTLKDWISRAYYNSEIGMQELGYTGVPHGVFEGCDHK
jgi:hypothetical protein